ncbi:MAG TPA: hypothetical protein VGH96_02355 [Streptosporangiaceae bacterium]|jgi:hypothetical protein
MKDTKVSTGTDKKFDGFTDGERGAMKERAKDLKRPLARLATHTGRSACNHLLCVGARSVSQRLVT